MKPKQDTTTADNQGEGNVDAARRYNEQQQRFVQSGAVADGAKRAQPETAAEAEEMLDAEQQGLNRAKAEDPSVPGANAKSKVKVGRRV